MYISPVVKFSRGHWNLVDQSVNTQHIVIIHSYKVIEIVIGQSKDEMIQESFSELCSTLKVLEEQVFEEPTFILDDLSSGCWWVHGISQKDTFDSDLEEKKYIKYFLLGIISESSQNQMHKLPDILQGMVITW